MEARWPQKLLSHLKLPQKRLTRDLDAWWPLLEFFFRGLSGDLVLIADDLNSSFWTAALRKKMENFDFLISDS